MTKQSLTGTDDLPELSPDSFKKLANQKPAPRPEIRRQVIDLLLEDDFAYLNISFKDLIKYRRHIPNYGELNLNSK